MRTAFYFLSLVSLLSSGLISCKKADTDVAPVKVSEPSYFADYSFEPKDLDDDQVRVLVSFCNSVEPVDTEIGIYEFDPSTNADEDLSSLLIPRYDDDGNVEDREAPDGYVQIRAKYTTLDGTKESDFNKKRQFVIDLTKNVINIITVEDEKGILSYVVIDTTNLSATPKEACITGS